MGREGGEEESAKAHKPSREVDSSVVREAQVGGEWAHTPIPMGNGSHSGNAPPGQKGARFENPDSVAKDFLDRVWNAFGYEMAPLFRADNKFELHPYGER